MTDRIKDLCKRLSLNTENCKVCIEIARRASSKCEILGVCLSILSNEFENGKRKRRAWCRGAISVELACQV